MEDEFIRTWEYAVALALFPASVAASIALWHWQHLEVTRSTVTTALVAAFLGVLFQTPVG